MCEADTKNMIVYGYFGEKKTRKEQGKRFVHVFRGKQAHDPTLIKGAMSAGEHAL